MMPAVSRGPYHSSCRGCKVLKSTGQPGRSSSHQILHAMVQLCFNGHARLHHSCSLLRGC